MDSMALVEEQIKAGQKLVERLNREHIPVSAAAWIKASEGSQWYLYLVTPLVGEDRATKPAYRRVSPVIRQVQAEGFWIDPFEVKVIGPTAVTGEAIAEVQRRHPGGLGIRYAGATLGELSIEGAYIYPPAAAPAA